MDIKATDLTRRPPRSARVRLGGYVILPRMLDKGRAAIAGLQGEFKYNCPLDQQFVKFVKIDPARLKKELARGKGDGEILEWIQANAKIKRAPFEIAAWSAMQEQRVPADLDTRGFLNELQSQLAPHRKDVGCWFDMLDIDDFVSFGGKA